MENDDLAYQLQAAQAKARELEERIRQLQLRHQSEVATLKRQLLEQGNKVKSTLSFRLGNLLVTSFRSPLGILRLPIALWKLFVGRRGRRVKLEAADFGEAKALYYVAGHIQQTLTAIEAALAAPNVSVAKPQRDFHELVKGLARLQKGFDLPSRQPNPLYLVRKGRLLYCLHQSVPHTTNGYATRSHGIAVGLKAAGWEVYATTRPGYPWDSNAKGLTGGRHDAVVDGVNYTAVSGWNLNTSPLDYYMAEAADHFFREAQTTGVEVVVAASNHVTALPALIAARRLGVPFVYEVRGLWEVTEASQKSGWETSERYRLAVELETLVAREADAVLTLTPELREELVRRGVEATRISLAPNAVDERVFSPRSANPIVQRQLFLEPGIPVIGYAGSAVAYEGLELLMEALAILAADDVPFRFVLVGDGASRAAVEQRAEKLGITRYCRFAGRVPFEQVPDLLACMDIVPVPRLSMPVTEMVSAIKPLEAMAMAKAVVLSDVSPHKLLAGDDERALLFPAGDAGALATVLRRLIEQPDLRDNLGHAARSWIERERTWKKVTGEYSETLKRVLNEQPSPVEDGIHDLQELTIGLIADRFTTDAIASAVNVVRLSPEGWREELAAKPIHALLVESAWNGNDGQWHQRVGYYSDELIAPLKALVQHCREHGVPTLFWNKEDPVHFDRFRTSAGLFEHVFTTDSRRIIPYLATPGAVTRTASSIPFFAAPAIHNLLPANRAWDRSPCYGGTYYGARYPERTIYMERIMAAAAPWGMKIYDRQHNDPESPYKFPNGLAPYVQGGLDYADMIEAYKSHPVQINVNSVLDSPTMFSRRVVEAAACGSLVLSGPSLAMNRYLEGAACVTDDPFTAGEWLEKMLDSNAARWEQALAGHRAVMRAHTASHRLAQMLRTAGLRIRAPTPPPITVLTPSLSERQAKTLVAQTIRPARVITAGLKVDARAILERAGIHCTQSLSLGLNDSRRILLVTEPDQLNDLRETELEDLVWPTLYAPQPVLGRTSEEADDAWQGVATLNQPPDPGMLLVNSEHPGVPAPGGSLEEWSDRLETWAKGQPTLTLRIPKCVETTAKTEKKTLVIAGHDLKFLRPFYPYFRSAGYRLFIDHWNGHNQHNPKLSNMLMGQANVVFCEWMLGNAGWYGRNKRADQILVGRLHAQEIRSPLFDEVPFSAFDKVSFVGPHILDNASHRAPVLRNNGVVIPNGVDTVSLGRSRRATGRDVLGLVGIVPQSKRLDLALDILRFLRARDGSFVLRIKGKRPEEYPWMRDRQDEMSWYETQYRRIEQDPLLKGAVYFDPHGDDMPEWYAGIDFPLSTSDNESFHLTVADGAAAGGVPIVFPWEGADKIYPPNWIVGGVEQAAARVLALKDSREQFEVESRAARTYVIEHFSIDKVAESMCGLILEHPMGDIE